ncbi:MBL fold metallo-hydrolase [Geothrix mesophila]|uniref:MBL fold metallo-hydrolase n=1 Tax=Geothrix mesophila TaxID=2922723 RepID=UPI001FAB82A2|nr:MBL fold metallo-hydrolase [Geothrix sp. SG198]
MLNLETFPVGPLGCNCSLLWDPDTSRGVVVDPGGDGAKIRKRVEALGFRVTALLHTHAHFDHVGATKELQDLWQCPAYLHGDDTFLIEALAQQTAMFGMPAIPQPEMTGLNAGDRHMDLATLHTPGHTPGSCCFHGTFEMGQVLLAGDTLFRGGVGRTDLWGGSWDALEQSIRRELYVLDGATLVIPGHGPATTLGEEAASNPFVRK